MGKTRLALAVSERVRDDFQHGAFFVPLAGLRADAPNANDAIATAAADALNVTCSGSVSPARQLQNYLRDKELLLILDNLEQLMASAAWLVELVTAAPRVTLLLTSREPLNVRAEMVWRLEGLDVPGPDDEIQLRASEGVQLFVERAARAAGEFAVTPETLQLVSKICRRVQGMPLALELAAAWTRTRTLDEILTALSESSDFLATTQRDVPPRHQNLRGIWQGSWDLLTTRQQAILAQLAVFRNGFEYHAAKAIINPQYADLDALIDRSLLKRTEYGRYEIHELLHQFASENLPKDASALIEEHSRFYLLYTAQRGQNLEKCDPQLPLSEIRREPDNLRAAWQNAVEYAWFHALTHKLFKASQPFII